MYRQILKCCLVCLLATCARAHSEEINATTVAAYFDAAWAVERHEHPLAGAVVAVVRDGETVFLKGYGYADLERRIRVDPEQTLFRIASVTKTFVWTAVMQLVEARKLDLNADVGSYLDFQIPATFAEPITLRHLLAHTAGFEDFSVGGSARRAEELIPLGAYLAAHVPRRVRPPGRLSSYSNYGTALAGYVVQRVSGMPWDEYVEQRILQPLGMTSTSAKQPLPPDLERRRAIGYAFADGRFRPQPFLFDLIAPDGVMSATAADMTKVMRAHLDLGALGDERILAEATARTMQSELFRHDRDVNPFLYGFYRSDRNGVEIFGHAGNWNGFHSVMSLLPQQRVGIFVSFNSDSGLVPSRNVVLGFVDRFFPQEPPADLGGVPLASLADYTGEWAFTRRNHSSFEKLSVLAGTIEISAADDHQLRMVIDGETTRWIARGPDRFRELYGERRLVFRRDALGSVANAFISSSPHVALERLSGVDAPALHLGLLCTVGAVALAGFLGYSFRALRRAAPAARLPTWHAALGWLLATCVLVLLVGLVQGLSADIGQFEFGVPAFVMILQGLAWITALLALVVAVLAGFDIVGRRGSLGARLRFASLALAGLGCIWQLWYWNLLQLGSVLS